MTAPSSTSRRARAARREASRECAVIYLRVSTDEQVSSGAGLDAQEAECRRYAEGRGWNVVAVVREDAVSGKTTPAARPGFAQALVLLDACDAGTLLVRRQDRVSRRLRDLLDVLDHAARAGWTIATTDGVLDTASASGGLQVNVMASVAEYERRVIGERTSEALAGLKASGKRLGRPSRLAQEMPEVLDRIAREHRAGRRVSEIVAGLNADTVPSLSGVPWTHSTVTRAVQTARLDADPARPRASVLHVRQGATDAAPIVEAVARPTAKHDPARRR